MQNDNVQGVPTGINPGLIPNIVFRVARFINPLIKKPLQLLSANGFTELAELRGSGIAKPKLRVVGVGVQYVKEGGIPQYIAQHVQHPGTFVVHRAVKNTAIRIVAVNGLRGPGVHVGEHGIHVLVIGFRAVQRFVIQGFAVGGKPFVQPDVPPGGAGYQITEPLVGGFVGVHKLPGIGHPSHAGEGLVFHGAAPLKLGLAVLFGNKRVEAEQLGIHAENRRQGTERFHRPRRIPGVHVIHQGQVLAGCVFPAVFKISVFADGQGDKIGGDGVTLHPHKFFPPIG